MSTYYCGPSGTCLPRKGQASACDTQAGCKQAGCRVCSSGFCVGGVCCDKACASGACESCSSAGAVGTCTFASAGDPGANPTCAPYACDGVSGACPIDCISDAKCGAAYYGSPAGKCLPRKNQGAACDPQNIAANCKEAGCRECSSGSCVDGFCCDRPRSGLCEPCAAVLKQSGVDNGLCGPIKDGIDPRNECQPSGLLCGADGMCNGTGACRLTTPSGVSCGVGTCPGQGTVAKGELCDGAGLCATSAAGVECAPFLCTNGGCTTTCASTADCAANGWCSVGKCEARRANGKSCSNKEQCVNNVCVDGVCCNAACTGQCEACDVLGAEGTCAPVNAVPRNGRPDCAPGTAASPCSAARFQLRSPAAPTRAVLRSARRRTREMATARAATFAIVSRASAFPARLAMATTS